MMFLTLLRTLLNSMEDYRVIGIMSGTSLDGVDLAYCYFTKEGSAWTFEIRNSTTIEYADDWMERLSTLHRKDAAALAATHADYGHYLGTLTKDFILQHQIKADFVSSHGHTIFHQPHQRFTCQVGDGAAISAACGLPVVCDFRSKDVALGGQGAPLVPVGDEYLFGAFDFCLNLGGIANISFRNAVIRLAFDVVPCNMVLNELSQQLGKKYDEEGKLAAKGNIHKSLLDQLNDCHYYTSTVAGPKSLGREDVERIFFSIIHSQKISIEDKLRTFCEHIALQIAAVTASYCQLPTANCQLLITGGGAFNKFLVSRIEELSTLKIIIPEKKIIEYKEALIFAFLGVLRMRGEINCLKSVTGAVSDSIGGAIYN